MNASKVVVGIVTFDRYELLKICIESVLKQNYRNIEILVLDDASTDSTAEIKLLFPSISYFKTAKKQGQIVGRNQLMALSGSEYFFNLDDDAYFITNDVISKAVEFMNNNSNVAILGFDILTPRNGFSVFGVKSPHPKATFVGCGNVMRLPIIKIVNYYTPTWYGAEEEDLSFKVHDKGFDIFAYPGLFVWHEMTPIARDISFQWRSQVKNVLSIIVRFYPALLVVPLLMVKLISLFIFSVRKKIFMIYAKGVFDFFKEMLVFIKIRTPVKISTIIKYHKLIRS